MRLRFLIWIAAFWTALAGTSAAQGPVVVELFTSQGCSSCPPADELFAEIAQRDDVIALALHVDYWDYIGWKDKFANPAFTKRQRAYAKAAGERSIYTPQMVIGGRDHIIGAKPMKLASQIERHGAEPDPVRVSLTREGQTLRVEAQASRAVTRPLVVQVVTFIPSQTTEIRRGENAGRTLTYHNIVRDWTQLDTWDGTGTFTATTRVPDGTPVAILIQEQGAGAIVGAAQLR